MSCGASSSASLTRAGAANERAAQALEECSARTSRTATAAAAHARDVPRRPRQAARVGRGAVRPDAAGHRHRPHEGAARDVLRWRRVAARRAARSRPASDSPLHQFRTEVAEGFREAQRPARRPSRRPRGAGDGARRSPPRRAATSRTCSRRMLGEIARGAGDLLERTGTDAGRRCALQEGRLRPDARPAALSRGADLRVVVEAKDRAISGREMRDELREAKTNRGAAVGARRVHARARAERDRPVRRACRRRLLRHRPGGPGPGDARGGGPPRPARLPSPRSGEREVEVDAAAIAAALHRHPRAAGADPPPQDAADVHRQPPKGVSRGLDKMREVILARVARRRPSAGLRADGAGGAAAHSVVASSAARRGADDGHGPGWPRHGYSARFPVRSRRATRRAEDCSWRARCGKGPSSSASSPSRSSSTWRRNRQAISFNMLHKKDLSRIQMKICCPRGREIISRTDTVQRLRVRAGPVRRHHRRGPRGGAAEDGPHDRDPAVRRARATRRTRRGSSSRPTTSSRTRSAARRSRC